MTKKQMSHLAAIDIIQLITLLTGKRLKLEILQQFKYVLNKVIVTKLSVVYY